MDYLFSLIYGLDIEIVLRFVYLIIISILFLRGEISMSKFAQTFDNFETKYILNKDGKVVEDTEKIDLQEEMNSHRDDCLSSFLDKYLDFSKDTLPFAQDTLADGEYDMLNQLVGTNADRVLQAYDSLMDIRERYGVPEHFSNEEVVSYLRELANNSKQKGDAAVVQEKEAQPESEQEKLS